MPQQGNEHRGCFRSTVADVRRRQDALSPSRAVANSSSQVHPSSYAMTQVYGCGMENEACPPCRVQSKTFVCRSGESAAAVAAARLPSCMDPPQTHLMQSEPVQDPRLFSVQLGTQVFVPVEVQPAVAGIQPAQTQIWQEPAPVVLMARATETGSSFAPTCRASANVLQAGAMPIHRHQHTQDRSNRLDRAIWHSSEKAILPSSEKRLPHRKDIAVDRLPSRPPTDTYQVAASAKQAFVGTVTGGPMMRLKFRTACGDHETTFGTRPLGLELANQDPFVVVSVTSNSVACAAGVEVGWEVLEINGHTTFGWSSTSVHALFTDAVAALENTADVAAKAKCGTVWLSVGASDADEITDKAQLAYAKHLLAIAAAAKRWMLRAAWAAWMTRIPRMEVAVRRLATRRIDAAAALCLRLALNGWFSLTHADLDSYDDFCCVTVWVPTRLGSASHRIRRCVELTIQRRVLVSWHAHVDELLESEGFQPLQFRTMMALGKGAAILAVPHLEEILAAWSSRAHLHARRRRRWITAPNRGGCATKTWELFLYFQRWASTLRITPPASPLPDRVGAARLPRCRPVGASRGVPQTQMQCALELPTCSSTTMEGNAESFFLDSPLSNPLTISIDSAPSATADWFIEGVPRSNIIKSNTGRISHKLLVFHEEPLPPPARGNCADHVDCDVAALSGRSAPSESINSTHTRAYDTATLSPLSSLSPADRVAACTAARPARRLVC